MAKQNTVKQHYLEQFLGTRKQAVNVCQAFQLRARKCKYVSTALLQ